MSGPTSLASMIQCIHIVPGLPPEVGGVSDYAMVLTRQLVRVSGHEIAPIFVHGGWRDADSIEVEHSSLDLSGVCSAKTLAAHLRQLTQGEKDQVVVLLEYSGYGYAPRGAPWWLLRGLRHVCGDEGLPLITVFHEISASGPPWTSAFWLSPIQRWISKELVRISRRVFVNRPGGTQELKQWADNPSKVSFRPVFSNIGEPNSRTPLNDRNNCAVVFCGKQEKGELYSRPNQINQVLEECQINRFVDIGPRPQSVPDLKVRHEVKGVQPAGDVSRLLTNARLGFAHRRLDLLTKSGVVAAYLAHGVPPVVLPNGSAEYPPVLSRGTHYATLELAGTVSVDWKELSREGHAWYQSHAHSTVTAKKIWDGIRGCAATPKSSK